MGAALTCLDENSALDFLSGRLGPAALSEAERHLGTCAPCVELLARSAPFFPPRPGADGPDSVDRVTPPPSVPSSLATLAMPSRRNDRVSLTQASSAPTSADRGGAVGRASTRHRSSRSEAAERAAGPRRGLRRGSREAGRFRAVEAQ